MVILKFSETGSWSRLCRLSSTSYNFCSYPGEGATQASSQIKLASIVIYHINFINLKFRKSLWNFKNTVNTHLTKPSLPAQQINESDQKRTTEKSLFFTTDLLWVERIHGTRLRLTATAFNKTSLQRSVQNLWDLWHSMKKKPGSFSQQLRPWTIGEQKPKG